MGLEVKFPFMLLLLLPVGWMIFLYVKKNRKKEAYWVAGIRTAIFLLLILALAVPQILLPVRGESVIFLVDRSDSVRGGDTVALDWIDNSLKNKKIDDSYAIVTLGKDGYLEQQLGKEKRPFTEFNGKVAGGETNIEAGLQFAASLLPTESGGKIVLVSDGNETTGNSRETAKILKNRGIELHYVTLNPSIGEDMSITELTVPPSLYKGEEAQITLTIDSNASKRAAVRISVNHQDVLTENVEVKEGKNVYHFAYKVEDTGMMVFKGELAADQDSFMENNAMFAVSNVKGTPKVLVVQGRESGQIDGILEGAGLLVDSITPEKLPTLLSGYLPYQSIIFNNVPATVVTENQMNLIERAVKEFGVGFVMAGGDESFGLGGYFKTPIERLLPVDMDIKGKKEMPSLGLVIVMDRSGSMSGNKIELAKEAAARSVELLREEDTLGFIAFDDRPWVILETKPLKDKKKAVEKILSIGPGGGTEIYSSLAAAYDELRDLKLQRKHIILLTDGQSATSASYEALIEEGLEKNITLSTVAIGSDADRGLLEELATWGTGRFYDVIDATTIPSILSRETVMATRTYIEDNPFYPVVASNPDWTFLVEAGVPQMNAYIATTPKSRAGVPFLSEKEDPVLAEWQYGLGTSIAFTSDFSGKWSGDWARWEKWPVFVNHMVTRTLPQYASEPYRVSLNKMDGVTVVRLESGTPSALPLETAVVSETGEQIASNTKLVAPGKYELSIPDSSGMYFLNVKRTDADGQVHVYQTGFTVPYSEEYSLKGTNKELLAELAALTGGKALANAKDSFLPTTSASYVKQPVSQWLLLLAFLLFFVEVAIRRFGMARLFGRFKMTRHEAVGGTAADRLPTKEKVVAKVEPVREVQMVEEKSTVAEDPAPISKSKPAPKPKKVIEKPLTAEEREARMKRLLEAKNRKER
ncbi:VWA domain-containing protein [Pseudoneobacillus sp. C159]